MTLEYTCKAHLECNQRTFLEQLTNWALCFSQMAYTDQFLLKDEKWKDNYEQLYSKTLANLCIQFIMQIQINFHADSNRGFADASTPKIHFQRVLQFKFDDDSEWPTQYGLANTKNTC